ncbi:MAG: GGDEF domain-containing protein [Candidatus Omnitrophica bacterium]|nr:GGDEF domain-containing protein [Candidatus Omnitrophota bacterium]
MYGSLMLWLALAISLSGLGRWKAALTVVAAGGAWLWLWHPAGIAWGWPESCALGLLLGGGLAPWTHHQQRAQALRGHRQRLEELQQVYRDGQERLEQLTRDNLSTEQRITGLIELYQFTKEASMLLRVPELFRALQEHAGRSLPYGHMSFIQVAAGSPGLSVQGAILSSRRATEERQELVQREADELLPHERALLAHVQRSTAAVWICAADAATVVPDLPWPADQSSLAWVPLSAEGQPIGLLIFGDLAQEFLPQAIIIGRQLALQLQRVLLYQQVEALAVTDGLTKLSVRRHFLDRGREELIRARRHHHPVSLLLIDIDHFKQLNDQHGHLAGDVVLRSVAAILKATVREIDMVARYGGEEFVALLVETDRPRAVQAAQRIRAAVAREPLRAYDEVLAVTVSIGVAAFPDDSEELAELVDLADQALYQAKAAGRNCVIAYGQPAP